MTDFSDKVSALLDGETKSAKDVSAVSSNPEAKAAFARYSLIGALLRDEVPENTSKSFMESFEEKFAAEAPHKAMPAHVKARSGLKIVFKYIAQTAIAASVAAFSVIGLNMLGTADDTPVLNTHPYGGVNAPVAAKIGSNGDRITVSSASPDLPADTKSFDRNSLIDEQRMYSLEMSKIEAMMQDHDFQSCLQRQDAKIN